MWKKILVSLSVLVNVGLLFVLLFSVGIFGGNERRAEYFFAGCGGDFRCLEQMQSVINMGFFSSLENYQGDVYACKTMVDSPFTYLSSVGESQGFAKCVKMSKKYKGLGTYAIQSDSLGVEDVEEVKVEFN